MNWLIAILIASIIAGVDLYAFFQLRSQCNRSTKLLIPLYPTAQYFIIEAFREGWREGSGQ